MKTKSANSGIILILVASVGAAIYFLTKSSTGLTITTTSPLPIGNVSASYTKTLVASGGTGTYTWSKTGNLPAGLTMSSAGVISGTPTAVGTSTFTVRVTSDTATNDKVFTIVISVASSNVKVFWINGTWNVYTQAQYVALPDHSSIDHIEQTLENVGTSGTWNITDVKVNFNITTDIQDLTMAFGSIGTNFACQYYDPYTKLWVDGGFHGNMIFAQFTNVHSGGIMAFMFERLDDTWTNWMYSRNFVSNEPTNNSSWIIYMSEYLGGPGLLDKM